MATEETNNDAKRLGGYLKEKWTIGVSRISSDEVVRALAKVTSHKLKLPNQKHLERLIMASHGNFNPGSTKYEDVNGFIVTELETHTHSRNWVVVIKTMLVFHTLMNEGSDDMFAKIIAKRSAFNSTRMKDLADSPDGAVQEAFIHDYSKYLEERCVTAVICRLQRVESDDFAVHFIELTAKTAAPMAAALLMQFEVLLNVELRKGVFSNHATLEAFKKTVQDGKRLYVVLTKRVVKMLDEFEQYDAEMKKMWLQLFKRYQITTKALADLFVRMNSLRDVEFGESFPTLQTMPDSIIAHLENIISESEVTVTRLDRSALAGTESQRSKSPDLFKKKPTTPVPTASPNYSSPPTSTTSAQPQFTAMPSQAAARPNAPAPTAPQNFNTASTRADVVALSSGDSSDLFSNSNTPQHFPSPSQPQAQPAKSAKPAPDVFGDLFDRPAPQPARGGTAGTTAGEFDPFAAPVQQPQQNAWGQPVQQAVPLQQQHTAHDGTNQQQSRQTGPVDFFASAPTQSAQQNRQQPQRPAGATAADQQLDYFASQAQQKRAW
jgi:hypothetical protein